MIKVPPATQKVTFVPYKVDHIMKDMLLVQIIQHVVEFVHADKFSLRESDLQSFVRICHQC